MIATLNPDRFVIKCCATGQVSKRKKKRRARVPSSAPEAAGKSLDGVSQKNCGTGDGGFKAGNTCARGGSGGAAGGGSARILSADEFKAALVNIPIGSKIRIGISDGTTMVGKIQARAADGSSVIWRAKVEGAPGRPVSRALTAGKVPATSIELADEKSKKPTKAKPASPIVQEPKTVDATAGPAKSGSAASGLLSADDAVRGGVIVSGDVISKMDAIAQSLTKSQKKAVADYTLSHYGLINDDLRRGKAVRSSSGADEVDKALHEATNRPLPVPVVAHRIVGMDADKSDAFLDAMKSAAKSGENVSFPAYTSTTLDASQSIGSLSGSYHSVAIEIVAKTGLYVDKISSNSGEQEVILPKASRFSVLGVKGVKYKNAQGELRDTTVVQLEQL